jgi:L-lactate dehydrogenase (cytochrome)
LPKIRQAVGPNYPLLFDSGVRSGEDIVKVLALGADFVMLGRPFLYAIGADGARGLSTVLDILIEDLSVTLAQVGLTHIKDISHAALVDISKSEDLCDE